MGLRVGSGCILGQPSLDSGELCADRRNACGAATPCFYLADPGRLALWEPVWGSGQHQSVTLLPASLVAALGAARPLCWEKCAPTPLSCGRGCAPAWP